MTEQLIRVVIVDDHPLVREGVRHALSVPGLEVVGEAGTGADGIAVAKAESPDVIVLDINLPGMSGIETAALLRHQLPEVRILMLSVHDHAEYILESIKAGADGYLRKDSLPEALRRAVREVAAGRTHYETAPTPAAGSAAPILAVAAAHRLELLSRRERDVLIGIASGKANKEIAADLGLGVRTVESYRESLVKKLGIATTAGLTRFALETHLLGRSPPP